MCRDASARSDWPIHAHFKLRILQQASRLLWLSSLPGLSAIATMTCSLVAVPVAPASWLPGPRCIHAPASNARSLQYRLSPSPSLAAVGGPGSSRRRVRAACRWPPSASKPEAAFLDLAVDVAARL